MLYSNIAISSHSFEVAPNLASGSQPASATWGSNNRGIFIPFVLRKPFTAVKMFSLNGATASGNIDVGIYAEDFTRIVSHGGTAQAGTSTIQEFDITDTRLPKGKYYMAVAMSSTVGTIFRKSGAPLSLLRMLGHFQMASAYPLPAVATFTAPAAAFWPTIGITSRSVI